MSLEARISSLEKKVDTLIYLLEYNQRQWITPEEAAREMGMEIGSSREYTRVLAWLRAKGFLKKYIPGRPYKYDKENVRTYVKAFKEGKLPPPKSKLMRKV